MRNLNKIANGLENIKSKEELIKAAEFMAPGADVIIIGSQLLVGDIIGGDSRDRNGGRVTTRTHVCFNWVAGIGR